MPRGGLGILKKENPPPIQLTTDFPLSPLGAGGRLLVADIDANTSVIPRLHERQYFAECSEVLLETRRIAVDSEQESGTARIDVIVLHATREPVPDAQLSAVTREGEDRGAPAVEGGDVAEDQPILSVLALPAPGPEDLDREVAALDLVCRSERVVEVLHFQSDLIALHPIVGVESGAVAEALEENVRLGERCPGAER